MDSHPTSTTLAAILVGIAASTGSAAPPTSSAVGFDGEGDLGPAVPMLISEFRSLTPGGANAIAVSFDLEPGWHVYWPGQNTTGFPVDIILSLPEGISAGEEIWPTPERYELPGGILDHTFEDQVTVIIPIEVDERVESGRRVTIEAELDWLVCKDACLPGGAIATLEIDVAGGSQAPRRSRWADRFDTTRANVPEPLPTSDPAVTIGPDPTGVRITPNLSAVKRAGGSIDGMAFFPHQSGVTINDLIESGETRGGTPMRLALDRASDTPLRGVLQINRRGASPLRYWIDTPVPRN